MRDTNTRAIIISYSTFAIILFLARLVTDNSLFPELENWNWFITAIVMVGSLLLPFALFGPGVVTAVIIYRAWPGIGRQKFWQSLVPATAGSAIISPIFWMILMDDNGFTWNGLTWAGFLYWAVAWLTGTALVLSLDHWLSKPKKVDVAPAIK